VPCSVAERFLLKTVVIIGIGAAFGAFVGVLIEIHAPAKSIGGLTSAWGSALY
jgi:hypothetical protein